MIATTRGKALAIRRCSRQLWNARTFNFRINYLDGKYQVRQRLNLETTLSMPGGRTLTGACTRVATRTKTNRPGAAGSFPRCQRDLARGDIELLSTHV